MDATPESPAPASPEPASPDPAPPEAGPAPEAPPGPPPEPEVLAPEAERLAPCEGAARTIVDPDGAGRPSPVFLALVSIFTLASDIGSKLWAEKRLDAYPGVVTVWENHLSFVLAKNRGGAWGLLQGTNENVRRPFFLLVSAAAIAFIVTLYRRLTPRQRALKWGLPLVLGGALGNVFDRIRYGHVIDFIDYRADWLKKLNELIAKYAKEHVVTDHWPTFNVADIAICVGVGLMAIDMFTAKRGRRVRHEPDPPVITIAPGDAPPPPADPGAPPLSPPQGEPPAETKPEGT
jgi:signal peptidase II